MARRSLTNADLRDLVQSDILLIRAHKGKKLDKSLLQSRGYYLKSIYQIAPFKTVGGLIVWEGKPGINLNILTDKIVEQAHHLGKKKNEKKSVLRSALPAVATPELQAKHHPEVPKIPTEQNEINNLLLHGIKQIMETQAGIVSTMARLERKIDGLVISEKRQDEVLNQLRNRANEANRQLSVLIRNHEKFPNLKGVNE